MTTKRHTSTYVYRPAVVPDEIARLIRYGATDTDCDVWDGTTRGGYGVIRVKVAGQTGSTRPIQAHRFIYEIATGGPIPGRMNGEPVEVDHRCRNPLCVKPLHLEPVPKSVNLSRRVFGGGSR
ncbi:MAG: HNH endonuclease [Ilumatobacteraceae bacterium]|nr:HNH endonuclease [Ilumatobacteraceae bacterium]